MEQYTKENHWKKPPVQFVTFGEIQQTIVSQYARKNIRLSFRDALLLLKESKTCHFGTPKIPDFLSWNMLRTEELETLVHQIPIPVSEVLGVSPATEADSNDIVLPFKDPVQICLESYYAPKSLTRLPYFTVIYVLEGNCKLHTRHNQYHMNAGELAILSPDTPYRTDTLPGNLVVNIISSSRQFEAHFLPLLRKDNILSAFFRNALFLQKSEILFFMIAPSLEIRDILKHLFQEFVSEDSFSTDMFRNYLQIFYTQIIRSQESTHSYYDRNHPVDAKNCMPAVLAFIRDNYQTLTLDILARQFHYTPAYMSKVIKHATGKNYVDIIASLKLEKARELLAHTDLKIADIAEQVGYHSGDHFTHSFRQAVGISPREYRRSSRL